MGRHRPWPHVRASQLENIQNSIVTQLAYFQQVTAESWMAVGVDKARLEDAFQVAQSSIAEVVRICETLPENMAPAPYRNHPPKYGTNPKNMRTRIRPAFAHLYAFDANQDLAVVGQVSGKFGNFLAKEGVFSVDISHLQFV